MQKAAVIGAGSMGSGIAALLASAGFDVILFDMDKEGAQRGIDLQAKRRGFYHADHIARVTPASTTEDIALVADCDWVIEAIFENLEAKHSLYQAVEPHLKDGAYLTSNTSTLPLQQLVQGVKNPERFAITHFFNPPKVMRLVEIVATNDDTAHALQTVIEQQLGKIALQCRDTAGFIANRVGCYWMATGVEAAREHNISYELADAAFGRPFGIPRTGIFGLMDYIGLQLVGPIWGSLEKTLPADDKLQDYAIGSDEFIQGLVERGLTGRTGDGGFYRGRDEVITDDYSYRPRKTPEDEALSHKHPRDVMNTDTPGGRFAKQVFLNTLAYCCEIAPQISDNVSLIDEGLKLGFGWKKGIFELADEVGHDWLIEAYGDNAPALVTAATQGFYPEEGKVVDTQGQIIEHPLREGVVTLSSLRRDGARTVLETAGGALHVLDNGVGILDLHTPLNSLSSDALAFLREAVASAGHNDIKALVIGNDEPRAFSAGADLPSMAAAAASGDTEAIEKLITDGSVTMRELRNAPVPIVGAVRGVALGGGGELLTACDRIVVHADAQIGFPERNVGLYPGWTGTVAMLERNKLAGHADFHQRAFDFVAKAEPAPNAFMARDVAAVRDEDVIIFSADHVLARAIEEAEKMADGYEPRPNTVLSLYTGGTPLDAGWPIEGTTENDHAIVARLAEQYTTEEGITELPFDEFCEREVDFVAPVLSWPANVERTAHMAKTRKPLRN
ncbi:3-hydroxyacyl-CoA dehydrogenase NAD-binding domain-containing protein [Corynebacterium breve]|uniref:3-hydroxyacyl-CoA dehydrogenase NAD-binding domain-containing protein n=1 Tax=Corynebacterium breve TaxID=3049799 RepID=A0ABY8VHC1_9CORY|nr:3-hydroxyacyl-CoA dehydrogenase/enoyl-CoA hydratase family protein [Corynebacterium breve]WIM67624.1 3-hydroxyacyl-CoA dehydrogenase NAD-binding domain-containing protein [Corynebacterium breve]